MVTAAPAEKRGRDFALAGRLPGRHGGQAARRGGGLSLIC
jgi:hypothetical protein